MNIKTFKCKIFQDPDSEFDEDFTIGCLYLDLDMVSAWLVATDKDCTIVYLQGVSHELLIGMSEFSKLKGFQAHHKINLDFSKN